VFRWVLNGSNTLPSIQEASFPALLEGHIVFNGRKRIPTLHSPRGKIMIGCICEELVRSTSELRLSLEEIQ
jgi:hypothetical protein